MWRSAQRRRRCARCPACREDGCEIWLKDDGAFGDGGWGGNKVRKLEWILARRAPPRRADDPDVRRTGHELGPGHRPVRPRARPARGAGAGRPAGRRSRPRAAGAAARVGSGAAPHPQPGRAPSRRSRGSCCATVRERAALPAAGRRLVARRRARLRRGGPARSPSRSRAASCPSRRTSWSRSARAARPRGWRSGCGWRVCGRGCWAWSSTTSSVSIRADPRAGAPQREAYCAAAAPISAAARAAGRDSPRSAAGSAPATGTARPRARPRHARRSSGRDCGSTPSTRPRRWRRCCL